MPAHSHSPQQGLGELTLRPLMPLGPGGPSAPGSPGVPWEESQEVTHQGLQEKVLHIYKQPQCISAIYRQPRFMSSLALLPNGLWHLQVSDSSTVLVASSAMDSKHCQLHPHSIWRAQRLPQHGPVMSG